MSPRLKYVSPDFLKSKIRIPMGAMPHLICTTPVFFFFFATAEGPTKEKETRGQQQSRRADKGEGPRGQQLTEKVSFRQEFVDGGWRFGKAPATL